MIFQISQFKIFLLDHNFSLYLFTFIIKETLDHCKLSFRVMNGITGNLS